MAYTNPSTFVAGEVLTAAQQNVLAANDRFFHGPPTCRVRRAASQAMPNGAWDTIQWDTEDWDSNTMWSSTNNDQVFVRTAGKYLVTLTVGLAASTGGTSRWIGIAKNSTVMSATVDSFQTAVGHDMLNEPLRLAVSGMFSLTTSDYVTGQVFHASGAGLNLSTATDIQSRMCVLWVSS